MLVLSPLPPDQRQQSPGLYGKARTGEKEKSFFFLANTTSTKVRLCSRPARQPAWCLMSAQAADDRHWAPSNSGQKVTPDVPGCLGPLALPLKRKKKKLRLWLARVPVCTRVGMFVSAHSSHLSPPSEKT